MVIVPETVSWLPRKTNRIKIDEQELNQLQLFVEKVDNEKFTKSLTKSLKETSFPAVIGMMGISTLLSGIDHCCNT